MSQSAVYIGLIEPIDFEDRELWPDEKIGKYLLAARLGAEAENRGIPPNRIPRELAAQWVEKTVAQEAGDVANIPLEKALHLAASGKFEKAGTIFREWMLRSAVTMMAFDEAATGRRRQRANAKKPRPKKTPTAQSETVRTMRNWRFDGRTLQDFLDAAKSGSIDGLSITPKVARGVERFAIDCDGTDAEKTVARSTLERWWADAAKTER